MTMPILYSFRRCPYAMRARLAIASAGVQVELREVLLRDKPAALIAASAKATVPVLVAGNRVIDESIDIMRWALGLNDPEGWLTRLDPALIAQIEGPFKTALDRYKYAPRYDGVDPQEHRAIAAGILAPFDDILRGQPCLGGARFGFTDAATVTFVRQFANVDRRWFDAQPWPGLIGWLDRFLSSPRFLAIMDKPPIWKPGTPPLIFGATTP